MRQNNSTHNNAGTAPKNNIPRKITVPENSYFLSTQRRLVTTSNRGHLGVKYEVPIHGRGFMDVQLVRQCSVGNG